MSRESGWHDAHTDAVRVALILGVALAFLLRFWFKLPLPLTAVFAVLAGLLVYELNGRRRRARSRFFAAPAAEAQATIAAMLQTKGIPFTQQGDRFHLTEDELIVRVSRFRTTRSGNKGSFISLQPQSNDSRLLMESLQSKIDQAFAGKGL